jgi:hypothetical protein
MGLLYLFPNSLEEENNVQTIGTKLILRTYGLPGIFWVYLLASLSVILVMFLLIKSPLDKLMATAETLNTFLAYLVYFTLIAVPLGLMAFFFFQKTIIKEGNSIELLYKIFFLPLWRKKFIVGSVEPFFIRQLMDSPNMARLNPKTEMQQYMNKGYFELWGRQENGQIFLLDRHSRKADLVYLVQLLEQNP